MKPTITIDDFNKIDLRVGKVLTCEKVPKTDKLLKLVVDIGPEQREIVAGIAEHYDPKDLIGKSIVVVANLKAARLRGLESHGMLLAATNDHGKLAIVTVAGEVGSGSIVK